MSAKRTAPARVTPGYNVFHDYYLALVQALHDTGVSRTVYCVNIDAVIAALLLGMTWQAWKSDDMPAAAMEEGAFTVFLYARLLGCAAEIEDHLNRGRNMDTRTQASHCQPCICDRFKETN